MLVLNQYAPSAPVRESRQVLQDEVTIYDNGAARQITAVGQHPYTDRAHLKSRAFIEHIGPYKERVPMWECELEYSQRINAQTKCFVADVYGMDVFEHIGAEFSFSTGNLNARIARQLNKLPFEPTVVRFYQALKRRVMRT
jgi:hypothetical protein